MPLCPPHPPRAPVLLLAAAFACATACDRAPHQGTPHPTRPAPAPLGTGRKGFVVDMTMDCPAYVLSSTTRLDDVAGGVSVTVTTEKQDDIKRIQTYARYVTEASARAPDPPTALIFPGRTGNRTLNCPVVLEGTQLTHQPLENGARLLVTARRPEGVAAVRQLARERLDRLQIWQEVLAQSKQGPASGR